MTAERWQQAKQLFNAALEQPPQTRSSFLRDACGDDQELLAEVESLLAIEEADPDQSLASPLLSLNSNLITWESVEGHKVGHYRILRMVGEGGMGAVYLGERADDEFQQKVAIKLVHPDLVEPRTLRWFEIERHTLARLDHPNIVRLIDAGTEDGVPYLVMDYVEGETIDRYCGNDSCSRTDILQIFRSVCGAVHYAHQSLVVHRDLKPSNILVTPERTPKLLDFGIAKLLNPELLAEGMARTRTEVQPRTPAYASPEQILGEPITTASDVYALGVLLYRLLAGHHPFHRENSSPGDVEFAICNTDPPKPELGKDLDVIVLRAMHREPSRRYASADHLSEDLRRYMTGQPVAARGDSVWYRLAKFTARHRSGVAAAVLGGLALIASAGISAWYAHEASFEKVQAQKRFDDVRQLARFVLFDLDESILSGAESARKIAVGRALDYLDRIRTESGNDDYVRKDIIEGYLRIGDIQGNPRMANLGDLPAALHSYRKALDTAERLAPSDGERNLHRARAMRRMGDVYLSERNRGEAIRYFQGAARLLTTLPPEVAASEVRLVSERLNQLQMRSNASRVRQPGIWRKP